MLFYDLSLSELENLLPSWAEPPYRALQIWRGVYKNYWNDPDHFSTLPLELRKKLRENYSFIGLIPQTILQSKDHSTTKTLFKLSDGQHIEAVLMRYHKRNTLCISTQVGCAMGCVFCATGQMGFRRNLTSGEIIAQVMYYGRLLNKTGENVTNIVVMGMGEPFHNYEKTMEALDRLNDPEGYAFGTRRVTISTVGIIPAIKRFTGEKRQTNLAISLHSIDDTLRSSLLPINRKYPVDDLIQSCRDYTIKTGRRISFEWALIDGVNDNEKQAHALAVKLSGMLCHVNIIQLNPTLGYSGKGSPATKARLFRETLEKSGIACSIRLRRGIEIQAGCGQLANKSQ